MEKKIKKKSNPLFNMDAFFTYFIREEKGDGGKELSKKFELC